MRLVLALSLLALAARPCAAQTADTVPGPAAGAAARVMPGDQVVLRVEREPDFSDTFPVAENGEAVLPRLGAVRVADLTAGELRDTLRARYAEYLVNPRIEVTVLRRVAVHGEVRRPDIYMVDLTMTLRDVLAKAGGITEAGNPNKIEIVREGQHIQLARDRSADFLAAELRSGDQILVRRRSWMALNPTVAVTTATGLVTFVIGIYQIMNE
jgi:protein involved in polysaccharide export with SLBB domain